MKKDKLKVALYCRVGGGEQAEHMLKSQRERLEQYAKKAGLKIADTIWDMGTGASLDRPGWKTVLEAARQKQMQVLLVNSSDRISRNIIDRYKEIRKLSDMGVLTYSLNNDIFRLYLSGLLITTNGGAAMKKISTEELCAMKEMEGLVIQGCGGDLSAWIDGINGILTEQGILRNGSTFQNVSVFDHGGRTNLLFHLDGLNLDMGKLATWRVVTNIQYGSTWLSDYLDQLGANMSEKPVQKEKPDCPLIGLDGNIFNLMGIASRTLKENGLADHAAEMWDRVKSSGSYGEALCIIGEYVNITSVEEAQEQSGDFDMEQSY